MMPIALYNQDRLDNQTFVAAFVARRKECAALVERVRRVAHGGEATHQVIIGARGMGKTSLLRRCAIAIQEDEALNAKLLALRFREEQYNILGLRDLWRNCIDSLANWCEENGRKDLSDHLDNIEFTNEKWDAEKLYKALQETLKILSLRPVLLIDNLDIILNNLPKDDLWSLRRELQKMDGPIVVGASTVPLPGAADHDAPFFEFFFPHFLEPLTESEVLACLRAMASGRGEDGGRVLEIISSAPERIATLHRLTGGNPRVLTLIYRLLEQSDTETVIDDLDVLLDEVTAYYKSRVEEYDSKLQRAIIDGIALHWDPISSGELAKISGIAQTSLPAALKILINTGMVREVPTSGKKSGYEIAERFLNIWYLMRHGTRQTKRRVRFLVRFFETFYPRDELLELHRNRLERQSGDFCLYDQALSEAVEKLKRQESTPSSAEPLSSNTGDTANKNPVVDLYNAGVTKHQSGELGDAIKLYSQVIEQFANENSADHKKAVAMSLFNKGAALGQMNRTEEAITTYEDLVQQFGNREEATLAEQVAMALFNKGLTLGRMDRPEEEIAVYDDLIQRFGTREEPALAVQTAMALFSKAVTLGQMDQPEEEVTVYDDLIRRFGGRDELALAEWVAKALVNKAVTLGQMGHPEEEIAVYDDLVRRFSSWEEPVLAEQTAMALFNKGLVLDLLDQHDVEITVYDDLVQRFGARKEPELVERVAKALVNKGVTLGQMGRLEEEIAVYDELVQRLSAWDDSAFAIHTATAMFNKGAALGRIDRPEEEIAAYDDLIQRFSTQKEPALELQVAKALFNKAVTLGQMNRTEEAIVIYEDLVQQFSTREEATLLEQVAKALVNKGVTLGQMNRPEEEITVYDDLIQRFGPQEEPALALQTAMALFNKAVTLGQMDQPEEEVTVYDDLIRRFGGRDELALAEWVAKALVNKAVTLDQMDRPEEATAIYEDIVQRFRAREEPALVVQTAMALSNIGQGHLRKGRIGDATEVLDELLRRMRKSSNTWPQFLRIGVLTTSGDIALDIRGDAELALKHMRDAISIDADLARTAEGNVPWALLFLGEAAAAREELVKLKWLPETGKVLLQAAIDLVDDNFGTSVTRFGEAIGGNLSEGSLRFDDDAERYLRLTKLHGYGEKLLEWFESSGHDQRSAPLYAAFKAYREGDRMLNDFNAEVRAAARPILNRLKGLRDAEAEKDKKIILKSQPKP